MTFFSGKFPRNWNSFISVLEIAGIVLALWWIPYDRLPAPGYSVMLIAIAAALMSIHEGMTNWQKGGWVVIMIFFLFDESRAIKKDRWDNEQRQTSELSQEQLSFKTLLREGRTANSTLLTANAKTLSSILQQNQAEFKATTQSFDKGQGLQRRAFGTILSKQEQLFNHEEELAEAEVGTLKPANEATPSNSCGVVPSNSALIFIGNESDRNVGLIMGSDQVFRDDPHKFHIFITHDKQNFLVPIVDLHGEDGKLIVRMNADGYLINRNNVTSVHKTPSSLIVTDLSGKVALDVDYINKETMRIGGEWITLAKSWHNTCFSGARLPM